MTGTSWLAISTGVLALLASPATVCAQPQVGSFADLSAFAGERVDVRQITCGREADKGIDGHRPSEGGV